MTLLREIEFLAAELDAGRPVTTRWLSSALPWGAFQRRHRLLYLAQRGRCGLCRTLIPLHLPQNDPEGVSRDHIIPRFTGGKGLANNVLLAHARCNWDRKATPPSADYRAFAGDVYRRLARFNGEAPQIIAARALLTQARAA